MSAIGASAKEMRRPGDGDRRYSSRTLAPVVRLLRRFRPQRHRSGTAASCVARQKWWSLLRGDLASTAPAAARTSTNTSALRSCRPTITFRMSAAKRCAESSGPGQAYAQPDWAAPRASVSLCATAGDSFNERPHTLD